MKKILLSVILLTFLFAPRAEAHQPRIVEGGGVVEVKNPEVSQAFYGELTGHPQVFRIQSEKPFKLYAGLLVPDVPEAKKDLSMAITREGVPVAAYDGTKWPWKRFYEEFGGDWYWWGPETGPIGQTTKLSPAGTYEIRVFSPSNLGKYSLAVGEIESFPLSEIWNTIVRMPWIKAHIFDKSPLTDFLNRIGLYIFGPIVGLVVVGLGVWFGIRWVKRRKVKKTGRKRKN
jgi:hypothetical protein